MRSVWNGIHYNPTGAIFWLNDEWVCVGKANYHRSVNKWMVTIVDGLVTKIMDDKYVSSLGRSNPQASDLDKGSIRQQSTSEKRQFTLVATSNYFQK